MIGVQTYDQRHGVLLKKRYGATGPPAASGNNVNGILYIPGIRISESKNPLSESDPNIRFFFFRSDIQIRKVLRVSDFSDKTK